MSAVSTYGLVNARVRTRRSALLSASSYKALASATDLPEMLNLLTRYKIVSVSKTFLIIRLKLWSGY